MNNLTVEIVQAGGGIRLDLDLTSLLILVILLVLFLVLKTVVFNPFLKDLDQRDVRTDQARQNAQDLNAKAQSLSEKYKEVVAQARTDAQEIRRNLRVEGLNDKESRVADAQKEANTQYDEMCTSLNEQFEKARSQALSQVEDLAREITSKVLGRKV